MDIRTPYIRTPYIGTPSIKAQSVGACLVTGATKDIIATPVITLTDNSVTITCNTTGATIYYTLDGSTPTSSSSQYSSAFTLDSSCTIKAIAIKGGKSSGIAEEEYVKPITYLTQWKIVGNSEVHGVGNLTSWKVSGNSIVDNNTILSCGDYSEVDGKYHVKISNGVSIYDIPLDAPLRKVGDVADIIEFPSDTEGKAIVTRNIAIAWWKDMNIIYELFSNQKVSNYERFYTTSLKNVIGNITGLNSSICLSANYEQDSTPVSLKSAKDFCMCVFDKYLYIRDIDCHSKADFEAKNVNNYFFYVLATPTTELVDVSPFAVSPTNTYTSANVVPYSAFEHTENKEIWSCGEYNATDGKYHILVQPLGGSIVDIALAEPLRKVNDVADTIEVPSSVEGKALVTRNIAELSVAGNVIIYRNTNREDEWRWNLRGSAKGAATSSTIGNIICSNYNSTTSLQTFARITGIGIEPNGVIVLFDKTYNQQTDKEALEAANANTKYIYELATPITELLDAPQIEEAESYSMVISQGGKAVEWSSFDTD